MVEVYESSPARLDELIRESWDLYDQGVRQMVLEDGRRLAATCVLYSGGNDSTTLAHLFRNIADFAIHANTTIGVERTRQFVRDSCAEWGLPLIEETPPTSYRDLVVGHGFPGPAMHFKMYQQLKERCLRQARKRIVKNPRQERVVFLAGRRRAESDRRANVPEMERDGSVAWISPLVNWRKEDLILYRKLNGVPENPISVELGMSGECLCGSFAQPGEYDRVALCDHDVSLQIVELEEEVRASWANPRPLNLDDHRLVLRRARAASERGSHFMAHRLMARAAKIRQNLDKPRFPEHACSWGWGAYRSDPTAQKPKSGPMCSSCDSRWQPEKPAEPSPAVAAVLARRAERKSHQ